MELLTNILKVITYVIIIGAGITVIGMILNYLNAKIDEAQTTTKLSNYAQLNKYIDAGQNAITTAVNSVAQTYVDALKKEGKFDETAQNEAKTKAIEIAKTLISAESIEAIKTVYSDFDVYLANFIEVICKQIKN